MKTSALFIQLVIIGVAITSARASIFENTINVYKYGPPTYSADDVDRITWTLVGDLKKQQLRDQPDLFSIFLNEQLDESAHEAMSKYAAAEAKINDFHSDSGRKQLKLITDATDIDAILATNLNRIVRGPCIYEKKRFRDVELSRQTKSLLKQNPKGDDLLRLNWLLLKDARLDFSKGAIQADGEITGAFKQSERILHIEIFPMKLSEAELQDIWVSFSPTNRLSLIEITEDKIKPYADDHHAFQFVDGRLVRFTVNVYGYAYPNFKKGNVVGLGSTRNASALTLPCSVADFEKVFGKADEIVRKTMW